MTIPYHNHLFEEKLSVLSVFRKPPFHWECQTIHLDQANLNMYPCKRNIDNTVMMLETKLVTAFHTGSLHIHSHEVNAERVLGGYFGKEQAHNLS